MAKKIATKPKNVLYDAEIVQRLFAFGYFGDTPWSKIKHIRGAKLDLAIHEYQSFHGLKSDGIVGEKTARVLLRHRCGLPDFNIVGSGKPCKWPMRKITYHSKLKLPGITSAQTVAAYDIAFAQWSAVCNIQPERVRSPGLANILAKSGVGKANQLDARGGTLAWSELPCDVTAHMQLDQMFDEDEEWSFNMAIAVICHELGHALGLAHLERGNLMAPYYDPNTRTPQRGDIREMVALYGRRPNKPKAKVEQLEFPIISGTITINGKPYTLVPKV